MRNQLVRFRGKEEASQRQLCYQKPKLESRGALRAMVRFESGFGKAGNHLGQVATEKTVSHF